MRKQPVGNSGAFFGYAVLLGVRMPVLHRNPKSARHAMESELIAHGYHCDDRKKFDKECEKGRK